MLKRDLFKNFRVWGQKYLATDIGKKYPPMGPFDPENKITVSPADLAQLIVLSLVFHQFREEGKTRMVDRISFLLPLASRYKLERNVTDIQLE